MSIGLLNVHITEYKLLEQKLKAKASKGCMVTSIENNFIKYKRTSPKNVNFKIILREKSSAGFKDIQGDKETAIINDLKSSGWNFCSKNQYYLLFYCDTIPSISTDYQTPQEQFQIINQMCLIRETFFQILIFVLLNMLFLRNNYYIGFNKLYSNIHVFFGSLNISCVILLGVMSFKNIYWYLKNKFSLDKSNTIDCRGKLRHLFIQASISLVLLILAFILILHALELKEKPLELLFNFSMGGILILYILLAGHFSKDKDGNRNPLLVFISYFSFIAIMLLMIFKVKPYLIPPEAQNVMSTSSYQLTSSDLYDDSQIRDTTATNSWSPFVKSYDQYTEKFTLDSSNYLLKSTRIIARFDFMGDRIYTSMLPTHNLTPFEGIPSDESLAQKFNCDYALGFKVYYSFLILKKGNHIYVFEASNKIPLEDLLKAVKSKLHI